VSSANSIPPPQRPVHLPAVEATCSGEALHKVERPTRARHRSRSRSSHRRPRTNKSLTTSSRAVPRVEGSCQQGEGGGRFIITGGSADVGGHRCGVGWLGLQRYPAGSSWSAGADTTSPLISRSGCGEIGSRPRRGGCWGIFFYFNPFLFSIFIIIAPNNFFFRSDPFSHRSASGTTK
jgi:hypothetical protein